MKHLRRFDESRVSIFDSDWVKLLPKSLTIVTDNGEFELNRKNAIEKNTKYPEQIYNLMTSISIPYSQDTMEEEGGNPLADGEPDNLQFDIYIVKSNRGDSSNPDTLKLNIDMTYGDNMQCAFTIERKEDGVTKVGVHHYNGKNSIYDPETYFGFTKQSLSDLVEFFNRFGFDAKPEDFKFLGDEQEYRYVKPMPKGKEIAPMIGADNPSVEDLKGGNKINKIFRYDDMDHYKIDVDGKEQNPL